jgi:hypothetical protein
MRIANSLMFRWHRWRRSARVLPTLIVVSVAAVIQGCAVNAPSCDGRFEPINVPASVNTEVGAERSTSNPDADHERR